jgi:LysR family transcriptional regulator, transcriptional activator of the cysJI operon
MQVETLKVFSDLVDSASFSAAARKNDITQSAVSQQIRALEKKFGVVFFERGKKNFSITPEGQIFDEAAREILEIYTSIEDRLSQMKDVVEGQLRICTIFSIGLHDLPPMIRDFQEKFKNVEVLVDYKRYDQVYNEVLEGRADIGLVAYPQKRKGVVAEVFDEDEMVLICPVSHRFRTRRKVSLRELDGERLISFGPDTPTRRAVDKMLRQFHVDVDLHMEFDNIETVKRAVEVSNGISIVPLRAVEQEILSKRLTALKIEEGPFQRPLGLLRKRSRATSPAVREFVRILKGKREFEADAYGGDAGE